MTLPTLTQNCARLSELQTLLNSNKMETNISILTCLSFFGIILVCVNEFLPLVIPYVFVIPSISINAYFFVFVWQRIKLNSDNSFEI